MTAEIKITAQPVTAGICNFTVDTPLYADHAYYFASADQAAGSPLAEKLFALPGVTGLLIAHNQIRVNKGDMGDWMPLAKEVGAAIRAHVASGEPAVSESVQATIPSEEELRDRVQTVLDSEINPSVSSHGGHVDLIDVQENSAYIRMSGGCQGCGSADLTLKLGIERAIRHAVPEIAQVLDVTDHAAGRNPYYAR